MRHLKWHILSAIVVVLVMAIGLWWVRFRTPRPLIFVNRAKFIAQGTVIFGTETIASGSCSGPITSPAIGARPEDVMTSVFAMDPTSVLGYGYRDSFTGSLTIISYLTADTVNFKLCNSTAIAITPESISLNWSVERLERGE